MTDEEIKADRVQCESDERDLTDLDTYNDPSPALCDRIVSRVDRLKAENEHLTARVEELEKHLYTHCKISAKWCPDMDVTT